MSNKLTVKWIKPPPKNLDSAMEVSDFNVHWHAQDDVEVTTLFHYKDIKSKTILGGTGVAKRVTRGNPREVFPEVSKRLNAKKDHFYNKWLRAKQMFNQSTPFNRASNDTFNYFVNSFGMTPKRFAEKTGVENSVLFRELKGQRKLSLDKAITYAKALGCDPVDLLFEKQTCRLWGSVDLFNMHAAGNEDYWIGQIKPAPSVSEGTPEGGLLSTDQLIPVPRDIYRPEIKAILIDSLGSHLHNHFVYYYKSDSADNYLENKLVVVGRDVPELEEFGMETMQYFFGILKIEKGKQKIYNPEPTAEKALIATGPFSFIAPVVSMVKRGAMKKDMSYFESIEQAEQIKEAEAKIFEAQQKVHKELEKQLEKLQIDLKKLNDLTEQDKKKIKRGLNLEKIFKGVDEIPEYIRKKVG